MSNNNPVATTGTLFIVATPIGNIGDITQRARSTIKNTNLIACEDTRRTAKLLQLLDIGISQKELRSFNLINEHKLTEQILTRLGNGENVALLSDAGTPMLSDPGLPLVQAAYTAGVNVTAIPGVSAITACIGVCPIPLNEFQFIGFVERRESLRRGQFTKLLTDSIATIFFDSPRRILSTLGLIRELGYGDREIFVCRELTKLHEEKQHGSVDEVFEAFSTRERIVGEFVAVLAPNEKAWDDQRDAEMVVKLFAEEQVAPSTAARLISKLTSLTRQEAYRKLTIPDEDR